MDKKIY